MSIPGAYGLRAHPGGGTRAGRRTAARARAATPHGPAASAARPADPSNG
ncbi:hypothetical protein [Streptomyces sp. NBC_01264]|nr:hypothetical protein [Streptomyces sp. NBC_01264]MCX4780109.1 hypothetical protein [Streptomyces sp. NBC_01264]